MVLQRNRTNRRRTRKERGRKGGKEEKKGWREGGRKEKKEGGKKNRKGGMRRKKRIKAIEGEEEGERKGDEWRWRERREGVREKWKEEAGRATEAYFRGFAHLAGRAVCWAGWPFR